MSYTSAVCFSFLLQAFLKTHHSGRNRKINVKNTQFTHIHTRIHTNTEHILFVEIISIFSLNHSIVNSKPFLSYHLTPSFLHFHVHLIGNIPNTQDMCMFCIIIKRILTHQHSRSNAKKRKIQLRSIVFQQHNIFYFFMLYA